MGHDHHDHTEVKNLRLAFFLNFGFTIVEIFGGLWTNSTAILADAVHDLGDCLALGQAWYFESISEKRPTKTYTYGYRRFTLLGAVVSAVVLMVTSLYVLSEAIPRITNPEPSNAAGMVLLALLGVSVNAFAMFRLSKGSGANVRVVALHLLEDVMGWVAVLIVAVILLFTELHILDPILATLITIYILANIIKQLKQIVPVFLQATPTSIDIVDIERRLLAFDLVQSVHHLHLWSLDGEKTVLTVHLVTERELTSDEYTDIKQRFRSVVDAHGIFHSTLEVEWPDEPCRINDES